MRGESQSKPDWIEREVTKGHIQHGTPMTL